MQRLYNDSLSKINLRHEPKACGTSHIKTNVVTSQSRYHKARQSKSADF